MQHIVTRTCLKGCQYQDTTRTHKETWKRGPFYPQNNGDSTDKALSKTLKVPPKIAETLAKTENILKLWGKTPLLVGQWSV